MNRPVARSQSATDLLSLYKQELKEEARRYKRYRSQPTSPNPDGVTARFSPLTRALLKRRAARHSPQQQTPTIPVPLPPTPTPTALEALKSAIDADDESSVTTILAKTFLSKTQCADLLLYLIGREGRTPVSLAIRLLSNLPAPKTPCSTFGLNHMCSRIQRLFPDNLALRAQIQRLKIPI